MGFKAPVGTRPLRLTCGADGDELQHLQRPCRRAQTSRSRGRRRHAPLLAARRNPLPLPPPSLPPSHLGCCEHGVTQAQQRAGGDLILDAGGGLRAWNGGGGGGAGGGGRAARVTKPHRQGAAAARPEIGDAPQPCEHLRLLHDASECCMVPPVAPHPPAVMSIICALRCPIRSTTWPTCSSGTCRGMGGRVGLWVAVNTGRPAKGGSRAPTSTTASSIASSRSSAAGQHPQTGGTLTFGQLLKRSGTHPPPPPPPPSAPAGRR